jgi:CRP/FNR family transcriptional regulator
VNEDSKQGSRPTRAASSSDASECEACPIRPLSICAGLAEGELDQLAAIVSTRDVHAHGTVFSEGDLSEEVFNVTAGVVTIYKLMSDGRRQVTGFMFPGDFIGLSVDGNFAYSAEAVTPVTLCRFPRRKLDALLDEHPRLQRQMMAVA